MKNWKWWHIVALILEAAGLVFIVLSIATNWNDDLLTPVALCCVAAGNILMLVMNIRQTRKKEK